MDRYLEQYMEWLDRMYELDPDDENTLGYDYEDQPTQTYSESRGS